MPSYFHLVNNIELLHTFEVRIWPYFPRRSRVKFGQYAPNGCEVTILSNDWNESYCYRCISTFQHFKYPQKLDNIIYATPLYTGHRDDCSPLPFQVIQVSVVNFSRDRVMYTETNCPLTSTLLARCQNLAQPHVLFTDTARLTVLCVRSRDPPRDTSVIGTRTNRMRESVDMTNERLRA